MKKIEDILHLYKGVTCFVLNTNRTATFNGCVIMINNGASGINLTYTNGNTFHTTHQNVKPILRRLSDMTEEEALYIAWFNVDSPVHLEADARVKIEELNINVNYDDDGLMLDKDCAVAIDISFRCFSGQLIIKKDGTIEMYNDGELDRIERVPESFVYLLSKSFDLFNLIDSGLAIDRKTIEI